MLASVCLDRYLRLHSCATRQLLAKVYCKTLPTGAHVVGQVLVLPVRYAAGNLLLAKVCCTTLPTDGCKRVDGQRCKGIHENRASGPN